MRAFITGCAGTILSQEEVRFFAESRPNGLILFTRNCETPDQVRRLVEEFRSAVGAAEVFVLVDQEGGRVQRLQPPVLPDFPAARAFGDLYDVNKQQGLEAARLTAKLLASRLSQLGINVNCVPVLDIPVAGAHDIIGDRAYGRDAESISALGRAVAEGHLTAGVLPVLKHIPGHGRATADSHERLPVVAAGLEELRSTDFKPFHALRDLPLAMTAHIVYSSIDAEVLASASRAVITDVIRDEIGFDGVLLSDDLSMGALSGTLAERSRRVLAAGCDLALHCNGDMDEMREVAEASPEVGSAGVRRIAAAFARIETQDKFDVDRAKAILKEAFALDW